MNSWLLMRKVVGCRNSWDQCRSSVAHYCIDLADLCYQGYRFIWRNGRSENAFMEERLDRACANLKWREMFLIAKVTHLTTSYSDHDPIILVTEMA